MRLCDTEIDQLYLEHADVTDDGGVVVVEEVDPLDVVHARFVLALVQPLYLRALRVLVNVLTQAAQVETICNNNTQPRTLFVCNVNISREE